MTNYFELLGLEPHYAIDHRKLKAIYYNLSKTLHPDVTITEKWLDQDSSLNRYTQINDAFSTIKDPLKRLEHLLVLQQKHKLNSDINPAFLMKMMDYNEALMHIELEPDPSATSKSELMAELVALGDKQQNELASIENWTDMNDEDFRQANDILNHWRYIDRLIAKLS